MGEPMEQFRPLRGMRDVSQESWQRSRKAEDHLRNFFALHGYRLIETPILEPAELFLRKSGGELASRMYAFTDPGGNRVSLRPEYTSSVVRHVLELGDAELLPARFQYAGPVFRYEGDGKSCRQFTQMGAELLGSSDARADAEILSLSCQAISTLGLKGYRLELGDLGILYRLLQSLGLSERATLYILSNISDLTRGKEGLQKVYEGAQEFQVVGTEAPPEELGAAIAHLEAAEARQVLSGLLDWSEAGPMGQRGPAEVVERLLRKLRGSDDPTKFERGLEIASQLAQVKGEPGRSLTEAGKLIESFKMDPQVLHGLKETTELLEMERLHGVTIVLDFGLARGLAYYTGIVFEIVHPGLEASLGGGGRYDGLAKALGSDTDMPALGFAYGLESLLEALALEEGTQQSLEVACDGVLMWAVNGQSYGEALRIARELRGQGTPVELEVCGRNLQETIAYARARGIAEVITVDGDGKRTTHKIQKG